MDTPTQPTTPLLKQAACVLCHSKKLKCNRGANDPGCERCKQAGVQCVTPNRHVGRQKGVRNKRKGIEKALYQIEQAIDKVKAGEVKPKNARGIISNLQELLNKAGPQQVAQVEQLSDEIHTALDLINSQPNNAEKPLGLNDAENPLQLLARVSDLQRTIQGRPQGSTPLAPASSLPTILTEHPAVPSRVGTESFFVAVKANLDIGPDVDPIELGLVTIEESAELFTFFHETLSHTRWGLDPAVHSLPFVRNQSAFLFTSILAASALFLPSTAALSKRLSSHARNLAHRVILNRHRSVEILLAFMINVPWMAPGRFLGDDDTCTYIAVALNIALDLSLDKICTTSPVFDQFRRRPVSSVDYIDATRALHMDGFYDVNPLSEWGHQLLRRRERAWISLFVLERGVCLARGRRNTVPLTPLIQNCGRWHISEAAISQDGPLNSIAVLRRDLDGLFEQVRHACDSYQSTEPGIKLAQSIKNMIESFYSTWYSIWAMSISDGQAGNLPPYVEILVTHTRLSTYSGVINHPTAPVDVKRFFHAAALSSALNVLRAAIQGESKLKSMPNNTIIMISFAACAALSLSITSAESQPQLAPSVRNLINETADVLERIGSTPTHRNGASALCGRNLRQLMHRSWSALSTHNQPRGSDNNGEVCLSFDSQTESTGEVFPQPECSPPVFLTEPLNFSVMSNDQIIDAVTHFDTSWNELPQIPLNDMTCWEWFDFHEVS